MIKKNLLFALIVMLSIAAHSQTALPASKVPANVMSVFQAKFPTATNVIWEERDQAYFLPKFTQAGIETSTLIDLKGIYFHTATKIQASALPAAATSYISTNYAGKPVTYAAKITYDNNKPVHYEAIVAGKDLIFDATGTFINLPNNVFK